MYMLLQCFDIWFMFRDIRSGFGPVPDLSRCHRQRLQKIATFDIWQLWTSVLLDKFWRWMINLDVNWRSHVGGKMRSESTFNCSARWRCESVFFSLSFLTLNPELSSLELVPFIKESGPQAKRDTIVYLWRVVTFFNLPPLLPQDSLRLEAAKNGQSHCYTFSVMLKTKKSSSSIAKVSVRTRMALGQEKKVRISEWPNKNIWLTQIPEKKWIAKNVSRKL